MITFDPGHVTDVGVTESEVIRSGSAYANPALPVLSGCGDILTDVESGNGDPGASERAARLCRQRPVGRTGHRACNGVSSSLSPFRRRIPLDSSIFSSERIHPGPSLCLREAWRNNRLLRSTDDSLFLNGSETIDKLSPLSRDCSAPLSYRRRCVAQPVWLNNRTLSRCQSWRRYISCIFFLESADVSTQGPHVPAQGIHAH